VSFFPGGVNPAGTGDEVAERSVVVIEKELEDEGWVGGWIVICSFAGGSELKPAGRSRETEADGGEDLFEHLGQRERAGDVLKNAAALLFEGGAGAFADGFFLGLAGEGCGFGAEAAIEPAGPESGEEDGEGEEGDEIEEMLDVPPGGRLEEGYVGEGSHA
jgi:hypothetical protein